MQEKYLLTIVLPTLGRVSEVDAMLGSINKYVVPTGISFEIIVVDQNYSELLDEVVSKYRNLGFAISHQKVAFRGLSKAKNFGAELAKGKYVCFIDDDAEFLEDTVDVALKAFQENSIDVVTGRCVDRHGNDSVINFSDKESFLTIKNIEGKFVESTMFFKSELTKKYQYDENMGVGAFYGSQEGYDCVYRMLKDDVRIKFMPQLKFFHPQTILSHQGATAIRRSFTYRCGYGYLCKKHGLTAKFYLRMIKVILYLIILPFFKPKDIRFYIAELLGSFVGRCV